MITKFLNPKNDIAFRHIFGEQKNKDILISLLNSVLKEELHRPIKELELRPTIQNAQNATKKGNIIDVLCVDQDGCNYLIEMQLGEQDDFQKRATYYSTKIYSNQLAKGEPYSSLKKVIFLAFADFILFPKSKDYKNVHITTNKKTQKEASDALTYVYVELPKFRTKHKGDPSKLTLEEKFYYFLDNASNVSPQELEKLVGKDKVIRKAFQALDRFGWSDEEIALYESIEKDRRDYRASLSFAEKKAKLEVAKKMLELGLDFEKIRKATGLDLAKIKNLK